MAITPGVFIRIARVPTALRAGYPSREPIKVELGLRFPHWNASYLQITAEILEWNGYATFLVGEDRDCDEYDTISADQQTRGYKFNLLDDFSIPNPGTYTLNVRVESVQQNGRVNHLGSTAAIVTAY